MLLSASENSMGSIPSLMYQCMKARRLNMAENCSNSLSPMEENKERYPYLAQVALKELLDRRRVGQACTSLKLF